MTRFAMARWRFAALAICMGLWACGESQNPASEEPGSQGTGSKESLSQGPEAGELESSELTPEERARAAVKRMAQDVLRRNRPNLPPEDRYYRVEVDLTVEGEAVTVSGNFACRGHAWEWDALTHVMGQRLSSGAGVLVVPPSPCGWRAWSLLIFFEAYSLAQQTSSQEDAPLILWLDSAEAPRQIEAYMTPEYFRGANTRVQFHEMRGIPLDKTVASDPTRQIPALAIQSANAHFLGHVAIVMPKDVWAAHHRFAAKLQERETGWLDKHTIDFYLPDQLKRLKTRRQLLELGFFPHSSQHPSVADWYPFQCAMEQGSDGVLSLSKESCQRKGLILLYRTSDYYNQYANNPRGDRATHPNSFVGEPVDIFDRQTEFPERDLYYFDSQAQNLIRFVRMPLDLAVYMEKPWRSY